MKYRYTWIVAACLAALCGASAADDIGDENAFAAYDAEVLGKRVHVRAGPSKNFRHMKYVNTGDTVHVVGARRGWAQIQMPVDCTVYIFKDLVDVNGRTGTVNGDRVNVRARARAKADVVGQVSKGTRVTILHVKGNWLGVRPPAGITAWIAARFIDPPPEGSDVEK